MRPYLSAVLAVACCCAIAPAMATEPSTDFGHGPNPALYPIHSRPFGKSLSTWGELSVQWIYAQPFEQNPFFDQTGAYCAVDQHGPVWYLAPIAAPRVSDVSRSCTIPRDKAILLAISFYSNTYPCPDPAFEPAPGQSLYDFLVADAKPNMDRTDLVEVTLDGRPLRRELDYRFVSENLYAIKGDPSLQSTFDSCITTSWQPAIVDGFFMLFKPLRPGPHTIVRHTTSTTGSDQTFTYHLYIE